MKRAVRRLIHVVVLVAFSAPALLATTTLEYYKRGFAYYRSAQYLQAAMIWRALLKHRRSDLTKKQQVKTCLGLANAYQKLGKPRYAAKILDFADKLAPGTSAVRKARARLGGGGGGSGGGAKKSGGLTSMSQALDSLSTALMMEKATPGQGDAYFRDAIPAFKKAIADGKNLARAHYGLGTCLLYTESDLTEAEKNLSKSIELYPSDADVNMQMAKICKRKGDTEREIQCLDTAVNNGRAEPEVLAQLAGAYGRRNQAGDRELVLRHARSAIGYDASYGASIIEEVQDESLKIELGKIMAKAELDNLGDKEREVANKVADRLAKDPNLVNKLRDKYGDQIPDNIASKIPEKYRSLFEKNKDKIQQYLNR